MRVISGYLGGRKFDAPKGHRTHPMAEKVRGALFTALGDIGGLTALDAFAGSGALSIEAISRGATHATAIDSDKKAHQVIQDNMKSLGIENEIKATRANISSWSNKNGDKKFDLVFIDPPFDQINPKIIKQAAIHTESGGLIIINLPQDFDGMNLENFSKVKVYGFGDANLHVYRRN